MAPVPPDLREPLRDEERALTTTPEGRYAKYGITFRPLAEAHLELLRTWRNHPDITRFMVFQQEITPEMQVRWFRELDPARDDYSMIEFRGELIGMTHLHHID